MKRERAAYFPPIPLVAGGSISLYRQLYDWFRGAILGGQLRPGQMVPSTRKLAVELRISRAPVLSAFEQLHAEGYLETRTGAGTRVAVALPAGLARTPRSLIRSPGEGGSAPPLAAHRMAAGSWGPDLSWLRHTGAFRVGVPAIDEFPIAAWSSLLARRARRPLSGVADFANESGLVSAMGCAPLREAIAEYLATTRSVRCGADQIMIVQGTQHGLQVAARTLLEEGDAIWMEEPGYWGARGAFVSAGVELIPVPVDRHGLDVAEGMRRGPKARAVYVTPSHQFPLGSVMSLTRRLELLDWAARNEAWILEDDYDSEYRFAGQPIASLQGLDAGARVIYFGTFSKVLLPGLRMGYIVVPPALVSVFRAIRGSMDFYSPALFQMVLTDFIHAGHFARHIRRMKALYMARRGALVAAIRERFGDELRIVGTDTGMHVVALLPRGLDDVALSRELAEFGISAAPLSTCCLERPGRRGLILGYGNADPGQIHESVERLAAVLRQKHHLATVP